MRLGLLGLGRIGAFHAETLANLPVVDSLVVSDPVPAPVKAVAERFGAQTADSPEALLASGVDGVVIAAPTDAHPDLIQLCVAAGVPAFCEKPVAPTSAEAALVGRRVAEPRLPMRSAEPDVWFPDGEPYTFFVDRFAGAFRAELAAFTEVVAGRRPSPCPVADAIETGWVAEACTLSLRERRPVRVAEVRR